MPTYRILPRQKYIGNCYYPDREKDIERVTVHMAGYPVFCHLLQAVNLPAHMILLLYDAGIRSAGDLAGFTLDDLLQLENPAEPAGSYFGKIWPRYGFLIQDVIKMCPEQALGRNGWGAERPEGQKGQKGQKGQEGQE
jgi:hypothetical protein